ncbi:MAG: hypothetical protein J1E05_03555 [Eubacterium sp.]|nr:hypothetical protein [Eubacterium sp.]
MKDCETCGKELNIFNKCEIDGVTLCYDCAMKASEERLKKAKENKKNENSDNERNATLNNDAKEKKAKEIKPIINQVISDANRIVNENGKQNDSLFWIKFLKTVAKIEFVLSTIGGIVGAFAIGIDYGDFEGFLIGLAVLIGSVVASVLVLAVEMVFLNLAEDVSAIRKTITKNQKDV